ncbi:MAG: hypothetical protein ACLUFW_10870 [Alistipes sp.]
MGQRKPDLDAAHGGSTTSRSATRKRSPENATDLVRRGNHVQIRIRSRCSGLQTIPASLSSGCDKVTDVLGCFTKCASLTSVPENLLAPLKNVTSLQSFLAHCQASSKPFRPDFSPEALRSTTLGNTPSPEIRPFETLPAGLFKGLANATNFEETFYGCTALKEIPDEFFCQDARRPTFSEAVSSATKP